MADEKDAAALAAENAELREKLAALTGSQDPNVVDIAAGHRVWYVRAAEDVRPAQILSDGIYEKQRLASGEVKQYAHLAYGTADDTHVLLGHESPKPKGGDPDDRARAVSQRMMHEVTAHWDPSGEPGTWHLDGEAEHLEHPAVKPPPPPVDEGRRGCGGRPIPEAQ